MPDRFSLQVRAGAGQPASPAHKRFNQLVQKTEKARERLLGWVEQRPLYNSVHQQRVRPLQDELTQARGVWVRCLDTLIAEPGWTRAERGTLQDLLLDCAGSLVDADPQALEMKALHDKHADVDFDSANQAQLREMKGLFEAMSGIDLGDGDIRSGEDILRQAQERFSEQVASEPQPQQEPGAAAAPRRGGAAAERRREEAARQASQSLREVFRKLASALHPDRATDDADRASRTAMMQRVNQAYERNDLLALLELQLEIEQIDDQHLASAPAERVKHFNRILAEQLEEIEEEIEAEEMRFCYDFGLLPAARLNPQALHRIIDQEVQELRAALAEVERDRRALSARVGAKRWLKRQRQHMRMRNAIFDDGPYF